MLIEPVNNEWPDLLCPYKYRVDVDTTFNNLQHSVNSCLFPTSKIFDNKGNIVELRDLLDHPKVRYDCQKIADLFLDILAGKYHEAGEFLEASVIPIEVHRPYQLSCSPPSLVSILVLLKLWFEFEMRFGDE